MRCLFCSRSGDSTASAITFRVIDGTRSCARVRVTESACAALVSAIPDGLARPASVARIRIHACCMDRNAPDT